MEENWLEIELNRIGEKKTRKQFILEIQHFIQHFLLSKINHEAIMTSILTQALVKPYLKTLLLYLCKEFQSNIGFQPIIQRLVIKYMSKETQANQQNTCLFEPLQQFIGRYCLSTSNLNFIIELIAQSKNSQSFCSKFVKALVTSLKLDKDLLKVLHLHTNSTQIAALAINIVKEQKNVGALLAKSAYELIEIYQEIFPEFQNLIFLNYYSHLVQNLSDPVKFSISLHLLCKFYSKSDQSQYQHISNQFIQPTLNLIKSKYVQQNTNLTNLTSKLSSLSAEDYPHQSVILLQLQQFFKAISEFISLATTVIQGKKQLIKNLLSFILKMLYADSQPCVESCLRFLQKYTECINKDDQIYFTMLKGIIHNCLEYGTQNKIVKKIQQKHVIEAVQWVDANIRCDAVQQLGKKIANFEIEHQSQEKRQFNETPEFQNGADFMLLAIQKGIQYQFEYQFDERVFRSACNLLLFMKPILKSVMDQTSIKQKVTAFIKSIMNLNQSCIQQYKQSTVQKVIEILVEYSQEVIDQTNQYLVEVTLTKIIEKLPWSLTLLEEFLSKGFCSQLLGELLYQRLNSQQFRSCYPDRYSAAQKIWEILLKIDERSPDDWEKSDSWAIMRKKVGVRSIGGIWNRQKQENGKLTQEFVKLGVEFSYDLQM